MLWVLSIHFSILIDFVPQPSFFKISVLSHTFNPKIWVKKVNGFYFWWASSWFCLHALHVTSQSSEDINLHILTPKTMHWEDFAVVRTMSDFMKAVCLLTEHHVLPSNALTANTQRHTDTHTQACQTVLITWWWCLDFSHPETLRIMNIYTSFLLLVLNPHPAFLSQETYSSH